MADYTITLNALEDAVLAALAAAKAAEIGQPVTAAQLMQQNVSIILQPFIAEYQKKRETALVTAFRAASEDEKKAVEDALPARR